MTDFPKKGFSSADPDDEIDLEALVKKAPPPRPQQKDDSMPSKQENSSKAAEAEEEFDLGDIPKAPQKPSVEISKQPAAKPAEEFDIESLKPPQKEMVKPVIQETYQKPAAQKIQARIEPLKKVKDEYAGSYDSEAETEFDHPLARKKVRILPEFPTLVLIIIVSIVTAVITGILVRFSVPSSQSKVQEVLSNEENTSVKVNALEQSVSKLMDDVKALQEKANAMQNTPVHVKKQSPRRRAVEARSESEAPAPEGAETE